MTTLKSRKRRNTLPSADADELNKLVAGNNAFAFDLFRVIREKGTNLFFSPYSILAGLVLAYAGAQGQTEKSMAEALKFSLPRDRLHQVFNKLDLMLKERGQGARGTEGAGFKLHAVNALWGQKGCKFLSQFLDVLAQNYGAELQILDFINETEHSRNTINRWITEQTEGRINELIPEGVIDQLTRLILTNAIYFNAAWKYPFNKNSTTDDIFHPLEGADISIPMMKQTKSFRCSEGDNYQAVELPYDGQELSLVILLPRSGEFTIFEDNLNSEFVKEIIKELELNEVSLTMPKFEYESAFSLKDSLATLGMKTAFGGEADFSGMNGGHDLLIQDVLHKAFISADEDGTTAAAATAVIMTMKFMPALAKEIKIDRPFIFFIRDIPTNSIIFLGRVLNPAG
jgi:serpin B